MPSHHQEEPISLPSLASWAPRFESMLSSVKDEMREEVSIARPSRSPFQNYREVTLGTNLARRISLASSTTLSREASPSDVDVYQVAALENRKHVVATRHVNGNTGSNSNFLESKDSRVVDRDGVFSGVVPRVDTQIRYLQISDPTPRWLPVQGPACTGRPADRRKENFTRQKTEN
ncbi:hypothetical protein EJ08DRAFT_398158 [Tothia fuscella]|uniref:Uncharacterized protein n=1 Tax=Tothia fuscella TaxID=1048955 RepID=A0A9P4NK95_9PEZI|nr:hypothetical protein EJ08DRAFT_398158 [Tothia fuscella]